MTAKSTEEVFMGLDLSLTGAGVCVVNERGSVVDQFTVGYSLTVKARQKDKIERRLDITRAVINCCTRHGVTTVAVEDYAWSRKSGKQIDLAELRGVVMSQLWLTKHLEARPVHASTARKAVMGKGNIPKKEIAPALARDRGLVFQDHNAADAYVVAEWLRQASLPQPMEEIPKQQGLQL